MILIPASRRLRTTVCISLIIWSIAYSASSQTSKVLVRNAPANTSDPTTIQLKWYSNDLTYPEGVHVYRRTEGATQWQKLTQTPILRQSSIPQAQLDADPELEPFVEIVNQMDPDLDDFVRFQLFVKSFESNVFADFLGIWYEDPAILAGNSYQYSIRRVGTAGETELGRSDVITAGPYVPGPHPEGFTVGQEGAAMTLDWEVAEDRFYAVNIYRTHAGAEQKLNEQPVLISQVPDSTGRLGYPSPKFIDKNVASGLSYSYTLAALDFFGEETERTPQLTITVDDVTPPPPATGLNGEADSLVVKLSWTNPEAADLKQVELRRSRLSDGPYEPIFTTLEVGSYVDEIRIPGPYYYYVAAVDHAGNETPSRRIFVEVQDVIPPGAPMGLTVQSDTGMMVLSWTPNREPDLDGYRVYRASGTIHPDHYVLLNADPIRDPIYEYRLPRNVKNDFHFYVVAVDTLRNRSPYSNSVTASLPDLTPPETPILTSVGIKDGQPLITWVPNVDEDMAGYHVFRSTDTDLASFMKINQVMIPKDKSHYQDLRSIPGQTLHYRLQAIDETGNLSVLSNELRIATPNRANDATQLELSLKYKKRKKAVLLSWSGEAEKFTGFILYRSQNEGELNPHSGLLTGLQFVDDELVEGSYSYELRAYLSDGQVIKSPVSQLEIK